MTNLNSIEKQIRNIIDEDDDISKECYIYVVAMVRWTIGLIKEKGDSDELKSADGQGFTFNLDTVRHYLGIKYNSTFYDYNMFRDYILTVVTQYMPEYGYRVNIREEGNPVFRFTLMLREINHMSKVAPLKEVNADFLNNREVVKEFEEIYKEVKNVNEGDDVENIISMCNYTPKLKDYNWNKLTVEYVINYILKNKNGGNMEDNKINDTNEAVVSISKPVKKHWSEEFKLRLIELWQTQFVDTLGLFPKCDEIKSDFILKVYDTLSNEFAEELELHSYNKLGQKRTKEEIVDLLYFRYKCWIEAPNKQSIEDGKDPIYGSIIDNTVAVKEDVPINTNVDEEPKCKLHKYEVMFKYKMSKHIFSRCVVHKKRIEATSEKDALLSVLSEFYDYEPINNTRIIEILVTRVSQG